MTDNNNSTKTRRDRPKKVCPACGHDRFRLVEGFYQCRQCFTEVSPA